MCRVDTIIVWNRFKLCFYFLRGKHAFLKERKQFMEPKQFNVSPFPTKFKI